MRGCDREADEEDINVYKGIDLGNGVQFENV